MGASEMINSLRKPRLYLICMILLYCMNVHIYIYVKNNKLEKREEKKTFTYSTVLTNYSYTN